MEAGDGTFQGETEHAPEWKRRWTQIVLRLFPECGSPSREEDTRLWSHLSK